MSELRPAPKPKRRVKIPKRWDQTGFVAPKIERVHDKDHLADVRKLPCCACLQLGEKQRTRTEAHHTTTRGAFGGDDSAVPLCTRHHKLWHLIGRKSFKTRTGVDVVDVARSLWKLKQKFGSCAQ